MLVLSRKEAEKIRIGDDIWLTVNRIQGGRVTLGIEAPRDVNIVRGEIWDGIVQSAVDTKPQGSE